MIQGITCLINKKAAEEPLYWQGIEFSSLLNGQSAISNTEGQNFTFINKGRDEILRWYNDGNIFKRLPVKLQVFENDSKITALDGYFDLTDSFEIEEDRVTVKFKADKTKEDVISKIDALTMLMLYKEGVIKDSDFIEGQFVCEKPFEVDKLIMSIILVYNISTQIETTIEGISNTVAEITAMVFNYPTGSLAALVLTILKLIIQVAFFIALIALLVKITNDYLRLIFPETFKSKGMTWFKMMSAPFEYLGYTFSSDLPELRAYVYYPSSPQVLEDNFFKGIIPQPPKNSIGIPKANDFGYLCKDWLQYCVNLFNGAFYFEGKKVTFYSKKNPIKFNSKPFVFSDIYIKSKTTNASEIKAGTFITYVPDQMNLWSMNSFNGLGYEKRNYIELTKEDESLLKNLNENKYQITIAVRKDKKNFIQDFASQVVNIANKLASVIGKKLPKQITTDTIGSIVISDYFWSVPIIASRSGNLPANNKTLCSPKLFIEKYFTNEVQYEISENVEIPMRFSEFIGITKNNQFVINNKSGEFDSINYNFSQAKAVCTLKFPKTYTKKIKHKSYE